MSDEPARARRSPGAALRQLRESKGLTLDGAAEATHVKLKYLLALEQEDFGALLGPAYARSFLKAYAQFLDADPSVVEDYRDALRACQVPQPQHEPPRTSGRTRGWVIGACVVVVVITAAVLLRRAPSAEQPPPVAAPEDSASPYLQGLAPNAESIPLPAGQPMLPVDTLAQLQIVATDSTWVEVSSDGELRLHELLMPGDARIVSATSEYRLTLGNAGGVELTLNGERLPTPGPRGMVIRNMTIDAAREPRLP